MQSNFKHRTQQKRIGDSTSDQWIVIHKKERHKLSLPFIMIRLNMWYARSSTRCNFNVLPRQIATVFSRGRHHFAPLAAARNLGERLDASLSSLLSDKPNSSLTDAFQRAAEWHELEIQVEELSAALTMPSLVGLVDEAAAKETQAAEAMMSEYRQRLACHPALLARLAELRADPRLAERQRQLIDVHLDAVRQVGLLGALPLPVCARITALQVESASLERQFHRLRREFSATNTLVVTNRSDLDGVAPHALARPVLVAPPIASAGPWHLRLDNAALAFWLAHLTRATTRQRVLAQFNANPAHLHAAAARAVEHARVANEALSDAVRQYPSLPSAAESSAASAVTAAASASTLSRPDAALALSERRLQWLLSLKHKLMPRVQAEIAALAAFAKSSDPRFVGLAASDLRYFQHRYRMHLMRRSGGRDTMAKSTSADAYVQEDKTFLLPNVLRTLFDVTRTLFGLRVQCVSVPLPAWTPQASSSSSSSPPTSATPLFAFDLFDDAESSSGTAPRAIGRVYADLFARRGKVDDPCTVRLSPGRHASMPLPTPPSAGTPTHCSALPSVAIVCHILDDMNAPNPTVAAADVSSLAHSATASQAATAIATAAGTNAAGGMTSTHIPASALSIPDVKNLFHEWGHVLQLLVLADTHNARDLYRHCDNEPVQDPLLAALSMSEAFDAGAADIHGAAQTGPSTAESVSGDESESIAVTLREFPSRFFEMLLHDADVAVSLVSDASAPALRCESETNSKIQAGEVADGNHSVQTNTNTSAVEAQQSRGAAVAAAFAAFHSYELYGVMLQAIEDTKSHIGSLTPSSAAPESSAASVSASTGSPKQFHAKAGYAGTHHVYVWGTVMGLEAYRAFAHASAQTQPRAQSTMAPSSPAHASSTSMKRGHPQPSLSPSSPSSMPSLASPLSSLPSHARKRAAWSALGARFLHLLLFGRPPLVSGGSGSHGESKPIGSSGHDSGSNRYHCVGSPSAHARVDAFIGRRADALSVEL